MDRFVEMQGRSLQPGISRAAKRRFELRTEPLLPEMEHCFSCLIRKRVCINESADRIDAFSPGDYPKVCFRPVVTQACATRNVESDKPPQLGMSVVARQRCIPHWLILDLRRGKWIAGFGYGPEAARVPR